METKTIVRGLATAVVIVGSAIGASAQGLVLEIYGSPTASTSLFKFSGSTAFSGSGAFLRTSSAAMDEFKGASTGSDYVNGALPGFYNNFVAQVLSGNARAGVGGNWYDINYVHLDHDNSGDDFGFSIVNSTDVAINNGDIIQFAGQGIVNASVGYLNPGTYTFTNLFDQGTANLQINVYAVPEPTEWAAIGMLGAGLAGLVVRARRRNG